MPSQKQLRWAELRVGITVVIAAFVLMFLIFLMGGTTGFFRPTIQIVTYVDDASGLRNGAPVRLENVDIGNVQAIRITHHVSASGASTPVEIVMKINAKFRPFLHTDSQVMLTTQGVLGETYVNIDSTHATGPLVSSGAELPTQQVPDMQEVLSRTAGTLANVNILVKRVDRIVSAVENQQGSVGKLIYDKQLYNNLNSTVKQANTILTNVKRGRGSLGKLLNDDTLYNHATADVDKLNTTIDKINATIDTINSDQGTVGKLLHDPSLYNNANQTMTKTKELIDGIDRGQGPLGMMAKDQQFANKLNTLVTNLSEISQQLNAGQGSAGKLLKDPALYNDIDGLMKESRSLVAAVRANPKKYLSIKLHIF